MLTMHFFPQPSPVLPLDVISQDVPLIKRREEEKEQVKIPFTFLRASPQLSLTAASIQTHALAIIHSHLPFSEISKHMNVLIQKVAPENFGKLQEIFKKNSQAIKNLKEKGWKNLKEELREGMTEYDTLRKECVQKVVNVLMATLQTMGYDSPGRHCAIGTPGWNSDIDTFFVAPKNMPQQVQLLEKMMFDMLMFANFGGLSGFLFDTESYTQHSGEVLETERHLETLEGFALFARSEFTAALAQTFNQVKESQSEDWQSFKENQLEAARLYHNPSLEAALQDTFADLESLHKQIQEEIKLMQEHQLNKNDPTSKRLALMGYKMRGLLQVSKEMDQTQETLEKLERENKPDAAWQRDFLRVKLAQLFLLRTLFYDEGYTTQGAFRKTCLLIEGQVHQRKIEQHHALIQRHYQSQIEKQIGASAIVPWMEGFHLAKAQQQRAFTLEHFSSMLENLALYLSHFKHETYQSQDSHIQKILLESSKYSERVIQSASALLDHLKRHTPFPLQHPAKLKGLESQLKEFSFKVSEQVKIKRAHTLNDVSTETELLKVLGATIHDSEQFEILKETIRMILETSKTEGVIGRAKFDESILPEDRYIILSSKMLDQGWIKEKDIDKKGLLISDHPEVDLILKARCGFSSLHDPELYKQLLPYHQRSLHLTLESQGLGNAKAIGEFNRGIQQIVTDLENLCISYAIVAIPQNSLEPHLRLSENWKKAMHSVFGKPA